MRKCLAIALVLFWCLGSTAMAAVTATYLGTDQTFWGKASPVQGNWVGNFGVQGYHLLYWGGDNNEPQKLYPSYLNVAAGSNTLKYQWTTPPPDARSVINAAQTQRSSTCWYTDGTNGTGYVRLTMKADAAFILGVYMLDWDKSAGLRNAQLAVSSQADETTTPTQVTTGDYYTTGKWLFWNVSAANLDVVSIRMTCTVGSNATMAALTFDSAGVYVGGFSASDQDTGNTAWTDNPVVNVNLAAAGGTAPLTYQITESDTQPETWQETLPTSYTTAGNPGVVTLYGWAKDADGNVSSKSTTIFYSTAAPEITDLTATSAPGSAITVSWTTTADAVGWVVYGPQGGALTMTSACTAPGTSHSLTLVCPSDLTTYDLEVHANSTVATTTGTSGLATPTAGNVVWSGAAGTRNWSHGANWQGKQQPALTTAGTVSFTNVASVTDATVTSILDPQVLDPLATSWTIGGFSVNNAYTGTLANVNHNTDLGGNTLIVKGDISVAWDGNNCSVNRKTTTGTITNGTLQLGSSGAAKNLNIGGTFGSFGHLSTGVLALGTGATLDLTYLNNVTLGAGDGGMGILDLRNGQVANGLFKAANVTMSTNGSGGTARGTFSEIMFGPGSNLQNFEVTGGLTIANGGSSNYARIGSTANPLPPNVNIKVGVSTASRGNLIVGQQGFWSGEASLVASTGGTFEAYVANLIVAKNTSNSGSSVMLGTLDAKSMDSCTIDATNFQVGVGNDMTGTKALGRAYLPSGTATVGTLLVGDGVTQTYNTGLLELFGTKVAVTGSATVKKTGSIVTHVKGKAAGLDLAALAAFTINGGGSVRIVFDNAQDPGESGEYWGLRWEGDQRSVISTLNAAGKLTWSVSEGVLGSANIAMGTEDEVTYTYVSLRSTWPPIVIAKSLTVEVRPPDITTLVIDVADIDASPADPDIVSRTITCPEDTDGELTTVTLTNLTASSTFNITLTLTKGSGEFASEVGVLTVEPVSDGATTDLTWSGAASLTGMERRQWFWGANWQGGQPPAVDGLAALTFADQGIGTTIVTEDRYAGSLKYLQSTDAYATELSGNTLTVLGAITLGDQGRVSSAGFANGRVEIGILDDPCDLTLNSDGTGWSTLSFSDGATVGINLGTAVIGDSGTSGTLPASKGVLDLSGAVIADGLIKANSIILGTGIENTTSPQGNILVGPDSGLTTIEVAGTLALATGHRAGTCRFGDLNNAYKLPEGVNIKLGVDETARGNLLVGAVNYDGQNANALLATTSGGTFDAWLNNLLVGWPGVGVVDLATMDSCSINANTVKVGLGFRVPSWAPSSGQLKLPSGTLAAGTIEIGTVQDGPTSGLLQLNGTLCSVATSAVVGQSGTVQVTVGATSSGLDIADGATVTVAVGGKINIVFTQDPTGTDILWGLRWQGDHSTDLLALKNDGKLTWNTDAITQQANIGYDEPSGCTYVGIVAAVSNYPPVARVRNVTKVLDSAMGQTSVLVTVDEVNDASFDPDGPEDITDIAIACAADTDVDPYTVTLTAAGDYTVTLTITDSVGHANSADATITVMDPQASLDSLTWTGAAAGPEWTWGSNWLQGNFPANPTTGTLTFSGMGAGTNILNTAEAAWIIGGLIVKNSDTGTVSDITHTFDMAGKKLLVNGTLYVSRYTQWELTDRKTTNAVFTNGALQIGTPSEPRDIAISVLTNAQGPGNLIMDAGTTFEAYLGNISIGAYSDPGMGRLDLRGAQIVGGKLKADNITMSTSGNGSVPRSWSEIAVGDACGLQSIEVAGSLVMGDGNSYNYARIGDPDNGWALPAGVSIKLGTDAVNRGSAVLGRASYWRGEGRLVASAGGTFQAYLTELVVGSKTYSVPDTIVGTLDVRNMDSCTVDVANVQIGVGVDTADAIAKGCVYLPPGTAVAGTVTLGDSAAGSTGVLGLEGTQFTVTNSLTIKPTGSVATHALGTSCGLDLPDAVALTVADGGNINIVFDAPTGSGLYYGLRWAGDHTGDLQALYGTGRLTWDETALPQPADIFAEGGYTYVGVAVAMARVSEFTVADRTSGSSLITNEALVAVNIIGEGAPDQTIASWAVVETTGEPSTWSTTKPTSYTILASSGADVTLYAWVKDTAGNTAGRSATIYFNSTAPVMTGIVITAGPAGSGTATVTWNTDIPAEGAVKFGPAALTGATPNTARETAALITTHTVAVSGLAAGTNYKWVVVSNEAVAEPIWWPSMWPIPCDVNHDCKVNILDLISIRNKLNQPVTGDGIYADVNLPAPDGKINILDLIAVRNKLNTQCP